MEPGQSVYSLDPATLQVTSALAEALISHNEDRFKLEVSALKADSGFRVKIKEAFPLVPRFEVPEVLVNEPEIDPIGLEAQGQDGFTLKAGKNKIVVANSPFRMDFYSDGVLVISANAR